MFCINKNKNFASLFEVAKGGESMLYVKREGGKKTSLWVHVDVCFSDRARSAQAWDFFLLPGDCLPLVPVSQYRGWARAKLTLPDGEKNYAVQTSTYCERKEF